jgi:NADH-quinone oxidoreductase subunit J
VLLRNPVHCALSLVTTIFGIALLFIDQGAYFLAAVQVIVYAGAIVILFLFVIMLLGVDRREPRVAGRSGPIVPLAVTVGLVAVVELLVLVRVHYWATGAKSTAGTVSGAGADVQKLGQSIFTGYLLPFEMTSALLVIAVVAAVTLVRRAGAPPSQPPPRRAAAALRPHPARPAEPAAGAGAGAAVRQPAATGRPAASAQARQNEPQAGEQAQATG